MTDARETRVLGCPVCDWTRELPSDSTTYERLSAEVDAEVHWENEHGDAEVPGEAPFGQHRCPECKDFHGLLGSASCGNCGFIPDSVRA